MNMKKQYTFDKIKKAYFNLILEDAEQEKEKQEQESNDKTETYDSLMQKSNLDVKDLANIKPSENLDDTQKAKLLQKSFSDDKTLEKFVEEINNLMTYQGGNVKGLQQFRDAFVKLYKTPPAGVKQLSLTRKNDFVPVKDMYMTQAGVSISNSISWPICKSANPTEAINNLMNTNVLLMKREGGRRRRIKSSCFQNS